ncbi:MAG: hypothetical protein Q9M16_06210 [Mariprofundus sp.]|nr:hypothetical protein [Mariprofundus sp.]
MKLLNTTSSVISTRHKIISIFLIIIALFLPTHLVFAKGFGDCDYADMNEFKKNGFSPAEIRGICKPEKSSEQKKQTGQRCQTKSGVCGLYHLPPAPLGASCYCVNKYSGFNDSGNVIY